MIKLSQNTRNNGNFTCNIGNFTRNLSDFTDRLDDFTKRESLLFRSGRRRETQRCH